MRDRAAAAPRSFVARLARLSYLFLVMNCSAVTGMVSALTGRKVWR